jgi:hypothetical protein
MAKAFSGQQCAPPLAGVHAAAECTSAHLIVTWYSASRKGRRSRRRIALSRSAHAPWASRAVYARYQRHGTTSLFTPLDVKARTVIGKCMSRHRAQECRRFLDTVEQKVSPSWATV